MADGDLTARILPATGGIEKAQWDRLAGASNPFVSHDFLTIMEDSGSVGPGTGWQSATLVLEDGAGTLLGAMPSYLKQHSQGEYVFDHHWADAFERAGGSYYPKLQIAAPFTPATGPRLLLSDPAYAAPLLAAAEQLCLQNGFSSAHATFIEPGQQPVFEEAGWMLRADLQFHWHNHDFASFDDFLATLASRKRKDLRKERAAAQAEVEIQRLRGADIRAEHWDAFWEFYQDTGARKWGTPYLTRAAFDLISERMGERVLLVLALQDGEPIAGALNFIGGEALYGRYWGCTEHHPFLHFELCYYRAMDFAIAHGLSRVEAGAQGEHKLARGYLPSPTWSLHWMRDPGFASAVGEYLQAERDAVDEEISVLTDYGPFKKTTIEEQE